jgi:hypothetical protein
VSIKDKRRTALADLQEMLAEGEAPDTAIAEAALSSGLTETVVRAIGARLIEEQPKLVAARALNIAKVDRQRRAEKVISLYREALKSDPDAQSKEFEDAVGISDFSKDEQGTLFLRILDAWLDERVKN